MCCCHFLSDNLNLVEYYHINYLVRMNYVQYKSLFLSCLHSISKFVPLTINIFPSYLACCCCESCGRVSLSIPNSLAK